MLPIGSFDLVALLASGLVSAALGLKSAKSALAQKAVAALREAMAQWHGVRRSPWARAWFSVMLAPDEFEPTCLFLEGWFWPLQNGSDSNHFSPRNGHPPYQ